MNVTQIRLKEDLWVFVSDAGGAGFELDHERKHEQ
jgi:hypothetical protein